MKEKKPATVAATAIMDIPDVTTSNTKGKVSDIPVPKNYILQKLQENFIVNQKLISSSMVHIIEDYIKFEIPTTHLTHVSRDIKVHIETLIAKLIPNSTLSQNLVNKHITKILQNIIEDAQIRVAKKKKNTLAKKRKRDE